MKTIHLIFNAHLDPVWLWPWTAGLDETLATCRSACDRLDAHPDLRFTRGEAWVYQQIERCDPQLFARVRGHIETGRWEIVGGWWLQPDCNLPSYSGFCKQIELGRDYFQSRFGGFPDIAYNVDSFGHAASLPGLMRAQGQSKYIMMRPREMEMTLPARLFRWRGFADGEAVTTFRIADAYHSGPQITLEHLQMSLSELPDGVEHTMCFVGVGDHGGGPTESQIRWLRQHWNDVPDARLEFSTPSRFFRAVEAHIGDLPVVTGELQQHAIGCYSVYRAIKTATRRAEMRLEQAAVAERTLGAIESDEIPSLQAAWKRVCFAHFHDTLGGTSLWGAYDSPLDGLGLASFAADERMQLALRRHLNSLPDDERQRFVLFNASDAAQEVYVEVEPWLEWESWGESWRVRDESGALVPAQTMFREALAFAEVQSRIVLRARLEAGQTRVFAIDRQAQNAAMNVADAVEARDGYIGGELAAWTPNKLEFGDNNLELPQLHLIEDPTDTWSHDIDRYDEQGMARAQWQVGRRVDEGPLLASYFCEGEIGQSALHAQWRVYADEPFVELRLRVDWNEKLKVLKLVWPWSGDAREDGISGASLRRANDGRELPLRDWTLNLNDGRAIVCPDVYALDATPDRVRLTLLRAAIIAHHEPHPGSAARARWSDRGQHDFRFRFYQNATPTTLEASARGWHQPPLYADLTRGMRASLAELKTG